MKIKRKEQKDVNVLILSGSLQHGDSNSELVTIISQCLENGHRKFVIDLGKVKYFYSTALGSLLAAYKMVTESGGIFVLARSTRKINSVMIQTQLIRFFKNYDSIKEAVESIQTQNTSVHNLNNPQPERVQSTKGD